MVLDIVAFISGIVVAWMLIVKWRRGNAELKASDWNLASASTEGSYVFTE